MEEQEEKLYNISLKILTDDPTLSALVADYWQLDLKKKPVYNATSLKEKYGLGKEAISSYVKGHFLAFDPLTICTQCGNPLKYLEDRDFINWRGSSECMDCIKKERLEQKALQLEEAKSKLTTAFENLTHHCLNHLELKFLRALVQTRDIAFSGSKMGMSLLNSKRVADKLQSLSLFEYVDNKIFFIPEYEQLLAEYTEEPVKSIFGHNNQKLYRELKSKHSFVFPEVAIASFIVSDKVKHLFTEAWHADYFLKCRVDALITESNGWPIHAAELQGSRHDDEYIKSRDAFKELVLVNAGIPISYYRLVNNELKQIS